MIWLSYCTTCRHRVKHLEATYAHNISTQAGLPVEFVLVNYGDDEMDDWYYANQTNMYTVRYVKVLDPVQMYRPAHAKNIAHKWAKGHIVCNLDADNLLIHGHTEFVLASTNVKYRSIVALREDRFCGRIALKKRDFHWLGGYDERYDLGAAWEDTDLVQRALDAGFKQAVLPDCYYVALTHSLKQKYEGIADQSPGNVTGESNGRLLAKRPLIRANPTGWGTANVRVIEPRDRVDMPL